LQKNKQFDKILSRIFLSPSNSFRPSVVIMARDISE